MINPGLLISESYVTFAWELASIAFTILIIDRLYQLQTVRLEKAELLQQLRSTDRGVVVQAVERMRANGWLADGTLCRSSLDRGHLHRVNFSQADFSGANLEETDFTFANLERTNLTRVNLHRADLQGADLRGVLIDDADLVGANLSFANLLGCKGLSDQRLSAAARLAYAVLPDGQRYDGRFNLDGDLLAARLAGFKVGDEVAMARYYDVSLEMYRRGRQER